MISDTPIELAPLPRGRFNVIDVQTAVEAYTPFYALFLMHVILVAFLVGWWIATGFPPVREFLNIRHERPAEVVAIGVSVGVGGWIFTLLMAMGNSLPA